MAKLSSTQIYGDLQVDGEIKNKATTTSEGVVQLNDNVNSSSTTQGATANAVKQVNDLLSSHKTDTTSHITASERTTWNSKANATHTHTKSQITDFPTSLPANGGNADTVDGKHATDLVLSENVLAQDLNTLTTSGVYRVNIDNPNLPIGCDCGQLLVMHGASDTVTQVVSDYRSSLIYWRSGNPLKSTGTGTWGEWNKFYHTGNKPTLAEIGASPGGTITGTTSASANWYRIAQMPVGFEGGTAEFYINASGTDIYSSTLIVASVSSNQEPSIQQLSHSFLTSTGISRARVIYESSSSGYTAYLDVYVPTNVARKITVHMSGALGWSLVDPSTIGKTTINSTNKAIDLVAEKIVADVKGKLTGNADTATQLYWDRTINGTTFKGDSNITTKYWGWSRTLTIGDTSKSVDGSKDVSWSLDEIGAIPKTASCNKNWNWSGQAGQPTWVWGGNDVQNMYVYNPSNFSVANSATVGGVGVDALARYYKGNGSVNIADTNLKEFYGTCVTSNSSAPTTDWWHIINVPHQDSNGYGGQLAIGYHGQPNLMVRSAIGTSWGAWYDITGNIESLKSSVVSGKQEVVNAINDKLGYASGLNTNHTHADYAWWIRYMIQTFPYMSGYLGAEGATGYNTFRVPAGRKGVVFNPQNILYYHKPIISGNNTLSKIQILGGAVGTITVTNYFMEKAPTTETISVTNANGIYSCGSGAIISVISHSANVEFGFGLGKLASDTTFLKAVFGYI